MYKIKQIFMFFTCFIRLSTLILVIFIKILHTKHDTIQYLNYLIITALIIYLNCQL